MKLTENKEFPQVIQKLEGIYQVNFLDKRIFIFFSDRDIVCDATTGYKVNDESLKRNIINFVNEKLKKREGKT